MKNQIMRRVIVAVIAVALVTTSALCGTLAKYTTDYTGSNNLVVAEWSPRVGDSQSEISGTDTQTFTFNFVPTKTYDNVAVGNGTDNVDGTETFTVGGTTVGGSDATADKYLVAPGTSGSFTIKLSNPSDVAALFTGTFSVTNVPANFVFYYNYSETQETSARGTKTVLTPTTANGDDGTVTSTYTLPQWTLAARDMNTSSDAATSKNMVVFWEWAYEQKDTDGADLATDQLAAQDKEDTLDGIANKVMVITANVNAEQVEPK